MHNDAHPDRLLEFRKLAMLTGWVGCDYVFFKLTIRHKTQILLVICINKLGAFFNFNPIFFYVGDIKPASLGNFLRSNY